jgi:hypothetical protein
MVRSTMIGGPGVVVGVIACSRQLEAQIPGGTLRVANEDAFLPV